MSAGRLSSGGGAWAMQLVADVERECVYSPTERARCPTYWPEGRLAAEQLDTLLDQGYQRVGRTVFRTRCAHCRACEPVRVPIADFQRSRSQRRVWRRNADLSVSMGPLLISDDRVNLWIQHRAARGLLTGEPDDLDIEVYADVLGRSCSNTVEVRYHLDNQLVGVSFLDFGRTAANSAYHYFDPKLSDRSLGTYSVLREIELCRERGVQHYYLGLWAADARALKYKADYLPHERLIDGAWQRFAARQPWTPPTNRDVPLLGRVPTVEILRRRWG